MELNKLQGVELLKAAWDLGITSIDTANIYSNGESEKTIAKFVTKVRDSPLSRLTLIFFSIKFRAKNLSS